MKRIIDGNVPGLGHSERPYISNADFKARIAAIMRGTDSETVPLRETPRNVVRIETDRGFHPPARKERE